MSGRTHSWFGLLLVAVAVVLVQAMAVAGSPQGQIKYVPAKPIADPNGAVVYQDYCAVCHGPAGRGNGPAARHLNTPVPDLTRIALRDGKFDPNHVIMHIRHVDVPKSKPMPCWRRVLRVGSGDGDVVEILMVNLTRHLEALQVAP